MKELVDKPLFKYYPLVLFSLLAIMFNALTFDIGAIINWFVVPVFGIPLIILTVIAYIQIVHKDSLVFIFLKLPFTAFLSSGLFLFGSMAPEEGDQMTSLIWAQVIMTMIVAMLILLLNVVEMIVKIINNKKSQQKRIEK